MKRPLRLLTIAHSYVVALNRRLAHEMGRAGRGAWDVTVVAPTYFHGRRDLRPVTLEQDTSEPSPTVPVHAFFTRWVHTFFYSPRLRDLLRQGFDLVHCWEEPYVVAGGQIAWWTPAEVPLVFWTMQNLSKRYPPPFGRIERYCLQRCAGWIGCGRSVIDAMLARGYGVRPYRVLPLGVDLAHFRPDASAGHHLRRALGWEAEGPPVIGFLGRFIPNKGLPLLQRVLDGLRTPWRALFVGAGPLENDLRAWAADHGDRVRVCTDVRHVDVPKYLNAMSVLCAPSQTGPHWREQFGRMLTEGFACGVPVIGSDSGEIPHVLGSAGVIVGEQDEHGWSNTLAELLESPQQRQEMARAGLDRARAEYAWPVVARRHLDFFEEIVDNHRAAKRNTNLTSKARGRIPVSSAE